MSVSVGVVNCVVNSVWLMAFSAILSKSVSHIFYGWCVGNSQEQNC